MSLQSLAKNLFPLADASAIQPRSRLQSPFSPLVGWLATWLSSEDYGTTKTNRLPVPDLDLFVSPINPPKPPNTSPAFHSADASAMAQRDDDALGMRVPFNQACEDGLTKEEFDYVVNSLLEYLEEAKLASPESGCEEYEYYAPENTEGMQRHGLWYPPSLRSARCV